MKRPLRFLLTLVAAATPVVGGVTACRGPTEITVHIRTSVPCATGAAWRGVSVYTGAPGIDVETRSPVLTTTACGSDGQIGSLVLLPTGSKDTTVSVRVVAGVARAPEECAASAYAGCIVARRTLAFLPHEALDVEVNLTSECVGQACDPLSTCIASVCVDARLQQASPPPFTPPSAATDGGSKGPSVRCGDDGVRCPLTGNVCCVTAVDGGTKGACVDPQECPRSSAVLRCDDESDCPGPDDDAGRPPVCCLTYSKSGSSSDFCASFVHSSRCFPYANCLQGQNVELGLCEDRDACQHGRLKCAPMDRCSDPFVGLPGYSFCQLLP